jgi:pullulanase/glycogen debranching enzyme
LTSTRTCCASRTIWSGFVRTSNALAKRRLSACLTLIRQRQIQWHGVKPLQPDWGENSHSLAFTRMGFQGCEQHLILLNAYWEALQFELPRHLPAALAGCGLLILHSIAHSISGARVGSFTSSLLATAFGRAPPSR